MPIVYVNWDNYSGGINLVAHIKSLIHMLLDPTVSLLDIYDLSSNIPTIFFSYVPGTTLCSILVLSNLFFTNSMRQFALLLKK